MKLYFKFFNFLVISFLITGAAFSDINKTTDRYLRDKYGCMITTQDGIKPKFNEQENEWVSWNQGYADLNQDNIPEIIAGYEHEYSKGRGVWTRNPYQYGFYSTDKKFVHPSGTKFLAARTMLTHDFNGDGKDDVVFIQHGPDYAPYVPYKNEILLSHKKGYKTFYLPGGKSLYHGGAAGDFDNDGDIDIVTTPGSNNELKILLNNGSGKFSVRNLKGFGRNYNVKTWDIDGDGNLDLIFDGHTEPITILWGYGDGEFKKSGIKFSKLNALNTLQDAVFHKSEDGKTDVIIVSSNGIDKKSAPYFGYSLDKLTFSGRELIEIISLDKHMTSSWGGDWINFIHACDLQNDGKIDIIFENSGAPWRFRNLTNNYIFLDKIIWQNTGTKYLRHLVFDPHNHLIPEGIIPPNFFGEDDIVKNLGISLKKYLPNQTYAQKPNEQKFYKKHRKYIEYVLSGKTTSSESVAIENDPNKVSPKVKAILEKIRSGESKITINVEENNLKKNQNNPTYNSSSKLNDPNKVSPRVKEIIEKIKSNNSSK